VNIEEVNSLTNVKTYHLSVEYDIKTKKLIYNRKLQPGNGSTLYGLEVCRSLDMDKEFLELANSVRHQLLNTHMNILPSTSNNNKYNKKVYLDRCQICNNKADEIHHIQQQKDADENGFIGSYHKNSKFNLVCLCEKCHDQVHDGMLEIYGYRQTSDGIELDFTLKEAEKGFNSIEDDIKDLFNQTPIPKKKDIITLLMQKHNVSKYKVEKVIKNFMMK
jgi:DNA mismatch repair protein MutS